MSAPDLDPRVFEELKGLLERGLASGELMTPAQVEQQTALFQENFGPNVLRALEGEQLLQLMHGRQRTESKCLAYWLEFKNDDEFAGGRFGGIGGGTAFKFGIYQRQLDGAWMTGSVTQPRILSPEEAIASARRQRDELLAGDSLLSSMDANDTSDEAYARLQTKMEAAAPELCRVAWSHKYWFLTHYDRLDDYHSPRYQRFHLLKLLQMPPDRVGILDWQAPRFICAGRFVAAARQFGVVITALSTVLNQRNGSLHRYWRIGTTEGDTRESHWSAMRDGAYVSIGWREKVPDLSGVLGQDQARDQIRDWLLAGGDPVRVASRGAGEIIKFAEAISENDMVLACEGQKVLGVGRVIGPYAYEGTLRFPHKRPVDWLLLEPWQMPDKEGLRFTVFELGKSAENLLELERRLYDREGRRGPGVRRTGVPSRTPLPPLDPMAARIENILRRKAQVILYGPPGTGKTYQACRVARDLASRGAFRKNFDALTDAERTEVEGENGLFQICSFHPGYGYEDFVEGLRPRTVNGNMVFERRDGVFKKLCDHAALHSDRDYFLVIDEINRGDVPRIFGELITIIERDKRKTLITLPQSSQRWSVPPNVFLIGTMNTADRSISLLDVALRRRFGFVELMPDSSHLAGRKVGELWLGPWLDALNARLRRHLKRDARNLQVGHAYLMTSPPITSASEFARVLRDDIIPLIEEYCYDDFDTLRDILGRELVDVNLKVIKEEIFAPNREEELIEAVSFEELQPFALAEEIRHELTETLEDAMEDQESDETFES